MEKKTLFLELPCELVEKIDRLNDKGDRSDFITSLLEKQITNDTTTGIDSSTDLKTTMNTINQTSIVNGEIGIIDETGISLGTYNLNTVEGFEKLAKKVEELSEDPVVKIRARRLL